ncbi:hypothetical protein [Cellulomonas sp. P5_C5]
MAGNRSWGPPEVIPALLGASRQAGSLSNARGGANRPPTVLRTAVGVLLLGGWDQDDLAVQVVEPVEAFGDGDLEDVELFRSQQDGDEGLLRG